MKKFIVSGAIHGLLAVALGAFAAHGLADVLDAYGADIWAKAVQYQMFHAAGLLVIGILMSRNIIGNNKGLNIAGWCMNAGIVFFSGSLYILALSGIKVLGAITPIGGVLFLIGWLFIIKTVVKEGK
ncbi:UPF0382 membrane protein [Lysinibacillus alkalisoli]|uniref:UPF0382 membrane protein n=1 Tax=Lysinibacillus alkalisoli TaxID=1911548 RepID=A0A917D5U1_9BACI|nr:DUF423 domain-containing protein [Lysinibacillus alkalisoli]GGG11908.1 UPF0382 membrane protein [Lysinibacillus alkalisoli]